jgi:hypothetical protein
MCLTIRFRTNLDSDEVSHCPPNNPLTFRGWTTYGMDRAFGAVCLHKNGRDCPKVLFYQVQVSTAFCNRLLRDFTRLLLIYCFLGGGEGGQWIGRGA